MRHSNAKGAVLCPGWMRGFALFGLVACLNPMPEEFPSDRGGPAVEAAGTGGTSGDYSNNGSTPPATSVPDQAPGAAGSAGQSITPDDSSADPDSGNDPDAGAGRDAADAGGE